MVPGRTDGRDEEEDDDDPELVVGKEEEDRYRTARDGDHLLAPFECDLCSFRNLQGMSEAGEERRTDEIWRGGRGTRT